MKINNMTPFQKKEAKKTGSALGGDTNTTVGTASGTGVTTQTSAVQNSNIGVDEIASADKISKSNATDGGSKNGKVGTSGTQKDSIKESMSPGEPTKGKCKGTLILNRQ